MSYTYKYPHPAVTTDCVILTFHEDKLKILLIKRGIEPFKGCWALPGGFMRIDESAEECAHRELREETGVVKCPIKQFHTFSAPGRDPRERVVTVAFYALVKWQKAEGADDAEFADWIPMDEIPPLAFDHEEIIKVAMETIRRDIFFEPVGFELLDDLFSMPQLQKIYELILGKSFDRRNFAKKMKHLGILEEVAEEELPEATCCVAPEKTITLSDDFNAFVPMESLESNGMGMNLADESVAPQNIFSIIDEVNRKKPKRATKRPSSWFRLNKKKYDELKDTDTFEF